MSIANTPDVDVRDRIYIGGTWVPSRAAGFLDVVNPSTEDVLARVPAGNEADVDAAVEAARSAQASWSATTVAERADWLRRIAQALEARAEEAATLVSQEVGMPHKLSRLIQIGSPIRTFTATADVIESLQWETELNNSLIVREPIGVAAAITPWNYPLHQLAAKVAPALGAGCAIVAKPSEVAPLTAFLLADVLNELGLPAGVFNLVTGLGPIVGEALARLPGVDLVSLTGSTAAGRRVSEVAAPTVKRVALELGGKSPNVLLDDAEMAAAVKDGVAKCFLNSGQSCNALSRMLVPRARLAEVEELAAAAAATYTPGDPFEAQTRLGPLVSEVQRERVRGYIERGILEGARLICGGVEPPDGLARGFFVRPTVFSDVTASMTIAREEIFGPVLALMPYDDEDDAVAMANDTNYGLAAGVWSADPARAERVARRLRAGQVEINGGAFNPDAPFGGYRQSGLGREFGRWGLDEYLEVKALQR